jgi:YD repeat-containing protein
MSRPVPLSELLDQLRSRGLAITVSDRLRVMRLLSNEADWTLPKLKWAVRALLVKDASEIGLFDQAFDAFFQPPPIQPSTPPPPRPPLVSRAPSTWGRLVPFAILVTAVCAALLRSQAPVPPSQPEIVLPDAALAGTVEGGSEPQAGPVPQGDGSAYEPSADGGARRDQGSSPKQATPESLADDTAPPDPSDEPQEVAGSEALASLAIHSDAKALACEPLRFAPTPQDSTPLEVVAPPMGARAAVSGAACVVAAAILLATWLQRRRRRRALVRRFVPGPADYRPALEEDALSQTFRDEAIEAAAADLVTPARDDASTTLDVARTVVATGQAGGYPRLVFARSTATPRYAIAYDCSPAARPWRRLYRNMVAGLRRAGLSVSEYEFEGDPTICRPLFGTAHEVPLSTLADTVDAVIFVGNGDGAIDRADGRPAEWLAQLERVPHRLWLNPLPPARWSLPIRAIAQRTPVAHGTLAGLGALLPGWVPERRGDDDRPLPPAALRVPDSLAGIHHLRKHLGAAFIWLCLCAVAGEPDADTALWLHAHAALDVPEADRLRLLALPWFAEGSWPAGLQERLVSIVQEEQPSLEARSRTALLDLLGRSEPRPRTVAHLRWRLDRLVHQTRGGRQIPSAEARDLVDSPIQETAASKLRALGHRTHVREHALLIAGALLLAGGIGVAGAAGWRWWFGSTQYCATWSMRWGVPVCVGPLSDKERSLREVSLRFDYRRGRLDRVSQVNAEGTLTPDSDLFGENRSTEEGAQWVPSYGLDGAVRWLDKLDRASKLLQRNEYVRQSATEWVVWHRDRVLALRPEENTGVVGERWTLDSRGLVTLYVNIDEKEQPRRLANGTHAASAAYDQRGRETMVEYYSADLKLRALNGSYAVNRLELDSRGDVLVQRAFDECGAPALDNNLVSNIRIIRDRVGNPTQIDYYGVDDKPTLNKDGVSRMTQLYDGRGHLKEVAYFDTAGTAVLSKQGFARVSYAYDAHGRVIQIDLYDAEGHPTLGKDKYARKVYGYDDVGHLISTAFYGTDGAAVRGKAGYARRTQTLNEYGDVMESSTFDAQRRPTLDEAGIATDAQRYDEHGHLVEGSFFGTDGKATTKRKRGYARYVETWDVHGNVVRLEYFDATGASTDHLDGYAKYTNSYDEDANMIETKSLGADDRLVLDKDWTATIVNTYDDRGRELTSTAYDTNGLRTTRKQGYNRSTQRYDARGRSIELINTDPSEAIVQDRDGVARMTTTYDARDNIVEVAYFDRDGKLAPTKKGYAIERRQYDARDNEVQSSTFGAHGEPVLDMELVARRVYQYDARGNQVSVANFDTAGRPTRNKDGWSRAVSHYDPRDELVQEDYFGPDGQPTLCKAGRRRDSDGEYDYAGGYARVTFRRDDRGNAIERAVFGTNGTPTFDTEGVATVQWIYDERGNKLQSETLDTKGARVPALRDRVCLITTKYDEKDRELAKRFFDVQGMPTIGDDGAAGWDATLDERGNISIVTYLDVSERPVVRKNGYATSRSEYDDRGNGTHTIWLDPDEKPTERDIKFASMDRTWDGRGNLRTEAFFARDGKPTRTEDGYERVEYDYDERDNQRSVKYELADGSQGAAYGLLRSKVMEHDPRGNLVSTVFVTARGPDLEERRTFDARDREEKLAFVPLLAEGGGLSSSITVNGSDEGWQSVSREYDEYDRETVTTYQDERGRPVVTTLGYAKAVQVWDDRGRLVARTLLDAAGQRIFSRREGYASTTYTYDEQGRRVSTTLYDARGDVLRQAVR